MDVNGLTDPGDGDPLPVHTGIHCPAQQATEDHLGQFPRPPVGLGQQGGRYFDLALQNGDARASVEVLKAVEMYGQVQPPSAPEDAEMVL